MPALKTSKPAAVTRWEAARADGLPIGRSTDPEEEELRAALRYAMLLVGIRAANIPQDEERAVLIMWLKANYPGITPGEIRLAFDLALKGELGVDSNPYENFSTRYVAGILNSYNEWGREQARLSRELKDAEEREARYALPAPEVPDADFCASLITLYSIGIISSVKFIPPGAYDIFKRAGHPVEPLTPEDGQDIKDGAANVAGLEFYDACRRLALLDYLGRKTKEEGPK